MRAGGGDTPKILDAGETLEYFESGIRDDLIRAGLDPVGTRGMAQVHLMVDKILQLKKFIRNRFGGAREDDGESPDIPTGPHTTDDITYNT